MVYFTLMLPGKTANLAYLFSVHKPKINILNYLSVNAFCLAFKIGFSK